MTTKGNPSEHPTKYLEYNADLIKFFVIEEQS